VHAAAQSFGHSCPINRPAQELSDGDADLMQGLSADFGFELEDPARVQAIQFLRSRRVKVQTRLISQSTVIDDVHQLVHCGRMAQSNVRAFKGRMILKITS